MLFRLKTHVGTEKSKHVLKEKVGNFIKTHAFLICPAINRRKVFLTKWMHSNVIGKSNSKRSPLMRLQSFFAATELIKRCLVAKLRFHPETQEKEWELAGEDPTGHIIIVHIREERQQKNRLLFYISSFYHKK